MDLPLLTVPLRFEHDVVGCRQRARQLAAGLGFDAQEQTRLSTAISEIARNAFVYAGGGTVRFRVENAGQPDRAFVAEIRDDGPGIAVLDAVMEGRYQSPTGLGRGLLGARRLVDRFDVQTAPGRGATVTLAKRLPPGAARVDAAGVRRLTETLARATPGDPFEELQRQNGELLRTMDELRARQAELDALNRELDQTNQGVVALYAELDEKAQALQRASAGKTRFLADMTHEFRTPLNSVLSLSRMLLDRMDGPLTPEQERQVRYVQRAAQDLDVLVNDLLDLAKVEAGKVAVRPDEFPVENLFNALRGIFRPLLGPEPATELVFAEPPAGFPVLCTDEGKVGQILRNLVANALKFTVRGEVRVEATVERENDAIRFTVTDTGLGIAPEHLGLIFEEFGQVDSPLQKRTRGTGLGLPLSRKLARLLGGDLGVRSEPGEGSVFTLTLPRVYSGPADGVLVPGLAPPASGLGSVPPPPPAAVEDDGVGGDVLIVDDDEASRYILRTALAFTGAPVREAANGEEALRLARAHRPRLVFLDLNMPGLSGEETLARLHADPAGAGVPVILHTSVHLGPDDPRRAHPAVVAVLPKLADAGDAGREPLRVALASAGWPLSVVEPA